MTPRPHRAGPRRPRRAGARVEAGVTVARHRLEPLHEMVPPARLALFLFGREAFVHQTDGRAALGWLERHRDGRRAGRQVVVALPAPGVDESLPGLDLDESATGVGARHDRPAVLAAARRSMRAQTACRRRRRSGRSTGRTSGRRRTARGPTCQSSSELHSRGARQQPAARARWSRTHRGCPQRGDARRVESIPTEAAVLPHLDEPRPGQHPEVLRDGGTGHREVRRQLRHGPLAVPEQLEEPSPVRLSQHRRQVETSGSRE